ncbi:MAG: hypothetical protein V4527_18930 [Pseudomonadota bacterium]
MILRQDFPPPGFGDWLTQELGGQRWCVAARLTERLRAQGYAVALPQARYTAHRDRWLGLTLASTMFGVRP